MADMNSFSQRLRKALAKSGMRPAELAKAIGASTQVINNLIKRDSKSSAFAPQMAKVLNIRHEWLATGEGEMHLSADPTSAFEGQNSIIPVLSNSQLVTASSGKHVQFYENQLWVGAPKILRAAFAFEIKDSSLSPEILPGDIVSIQEENDFTNISSGGFVLALCSSTHEIINRKYVKEGSSESLSPNNVSMYKNIKLNNNYSLLGRFVFMSRRL